MKISVDYTRCAGHGVCEGLAEDIFEVREDGVTHLLQDSPDEDRRDVVEQAVETCPTQALSITETH
jgi:ferredoxin